MPGKKSSRGSKSSRPKKMTKRASSARRPKGASKKRAATRSKSRPKQGRAKAKRPARAPSRVKRVSKGPASRPAVGGSVSVSRIAAGATRGVPAKSAKGMAKGKGKLEAKRPERGGQGLLELEEGPPAVDLTRDPGVPGVPAPRKRRGKGAQLSMLDYPGESLTVGMPAPEFSLPSTLGRRVTLSEFRGKRVILYFYPKDDTPGCTMEACGFRDSFPRIESKDAVVLGVSLDDELSHEKFAQKYSLPFPLLSDKDAAVSRQYGTYKEKNLYGRSFWGIERTTFVIDRDGKVEHVFRRVKVEGHAEEVMATLAL
jgi:thioredoxin-dependent peroxiredoxin